MPSFQVVSDYTPSGDQPEAIEALAQGVELGLDEQTLLGVTGSGKTFTMAKVIEKVQRPTLVLAHNHPSGVATPSQEDIFLTHYVQQSLQPLGITLYDHVILTDDDMVSLRDSRHLTPPSAF